MVACHRHLALLDECYIRQGLQVLAPRVGVGAYAGADEATDRVC